MKKGRKKSKKLTLQQLALATAIMQAIASFLFILKALIE